MASLMNFLVPSPCNHALYLQTATFVLLKEIFLSKKVVNLMIFSDITWKYDKRSFVILGGSLNLHNSFYLLLIYFISFSFRVCVRVLQPRECKLIIY